MFPTSGMISMCSTQEETCDNADDQHMKIAMPEEVGTVAVGLSLCILNAI